MFFLIPYKKITFYLNFQKFSPYAAHAFDAEVDGVPSKSPLLCEQYYNSFERDCGMLDVNLFNKVQQPSSSVYCFGNNNNLTGSIGNFAMSTGKRKGFYLFFLQHDKITDGCIQLCVEKVIDQLYTATSAKHCGDGTNR